MLNSCTQLQEISELIKETQEITLNEETVVIVEEEKEYSPPFYSPIDEMKLLITKQKKDGYISLAESACEESSDSVFILADFEQTGEGYLVEENDEKFNVYNFFGNGPVRVLENISEIYYTFKRVAVAVTDNGEYYIFQNGHAVKAFSVPAETEEGYNSESDIEELALAPPCKFLIEQNGWCSGCELATFLSELPEETESHSKYYECAEKKVLDSSGGLIGLRTIISNIVIQMEYSDYEFTFRDLYDVGSDWILKDTGILSSAEGIDVEVIKTNNENVWFEKYPGHLVAFSRLSNNPDYIVAIEPLCNETITDTLIEWLGTFTDGTIY